MIKIKGYDATGGGYGCHSLLQLVPRSRLLVPYYNRCDLGSQSTLKDPIAYSSHTGSLLLELGMNDGH